MKKRLFAIMLALAMLLAAVPALAEEVAVEQDNTAGNKICATDGCKEAVEGEGILCATCAEKKAEEAAKKAAEEEAARKAAEEEAAKKVAEEAAKKAAEEEALRKAAEEQKITEEKNAKKSPMLLGEANPAGAETDSECHHDHTAEWASTQTGVQGTMVEYPAKDPTCTSEGNIKYYTCIKCNEFFVEEGGRIDQNLPKKVNENDVKIPKTGHKPTKIEGKPATCTEAGIKEHYKCSVCGKSFSDSDGKEEISDTNIPALGHDYGDPTWNWCGVSSATATFKCKRDCKEKNAIVTRQARPTRSGINNCGYYTYTATVEFNDNTYTDTRTDYSCRPDWYYDPCYYNNPCGHWGCGNVCTRYSDCVPCQNYRTTFRVGGYNCLATPKTGDVSVMAPAMLALIGAAGAALGKKRR